MADLLKRWRKITGKAAERPPRPDADGTTYKPLEPLDDRIAAWRTVIAGRRRQDIYDKVAASVDRTAYRALQEKNRALIEQGEQLSPTKYVDLAPWFTIHARLAIKLDIDIRPPCSILDIGSGGGHFLAIARAYGHSVLALDQPEPAIYGDLVDLFGVPRILGSVRLGEALPAAIGKHDLICINGQVFDVDHKTRQRWKLAEWTGFLEYLTKHHLKSPGELFIGLNKSDGPTGTEDYFWPLVDLAEARGATVDRKYATMDIKLDAPLAFPEHDPVPWVTPEQV
jgi:SAM-dependent methyltransferase